MERQPVRLDVPTALGADVREARRAQSLRIDDAASLLGVSVDLMSRLAADAAVIPARFL